MFEGDRNADVLVIGGGMAGILAARLLTDAGVSCILLEGSRIGGGTTSNTTAKLTAQHGLIYTKLVKCWGAERARAYYEANAVGLSQFAEMCKSIDCDYQPMPAFVYSLTSRLEIEKEVEAAGLVGASVSFAESVPLPLDVKGAVRMEGQAQFHPLKFLAGVVRGLTVYENSFVRRIEGDVVRTDRGSVRAKAIVVATHFPFLNRAGGYFMKMYQHRSYAAAFSGVPDVCGMYVDAAENGLSFRNHEGLLIIGGGDHRTGAPGGGPSVPLSFAKAHYPSATVQFQWAAQDCISLDDAPYIGRYSRFTPNLYVATGFNKWGMSSSMVSAILLRDLITGRSSDFADVFAPTRPPAIGPLLQNALQSTLGLLNPKPRRCTHMGCALRWNPLEHSWDCSCHGSRFSPEGDVLENPATRGL